MFKTKMEETRLKNLQKSKSKFLSQIAANQMNSDPNATVEEKMEKLIKQAELLASFLLNKYNEIEPTEEGTPKKRGSASKRSRQKKQRKKMSRSKKKKNKGIMVYDSEHIKDLEKEFK
jgi:hypothetical protein